MYKYNQVIELNKEYSLLKNKYSFQEIKFQSIKYIL